MKKIYFVMMMVVMMISMSLTAYAGESREFKKVDKFYADEIVYDLPHAELSSGIEFVTSVDDGNYVISCDDDGTITMKGYCDGRIVYATMDVYVNSDTMTVFYNVDGNEYAETYNGSTYAQKMYNRS